MFRQTTYRRVSYGETDRMGYLYYGHYAEYYEVGRVEALRKLGIRYRDMEDHVGVMLPVTDMRIKYLRPAKYDEVVRIETILEHMPERDIHFRFELYNENDKLLNEAEVTLTFVSKATNKRCGTPDFLREKLAPYFVE